MQLELYHLQECPHCRRVRGYIESRGLRPAVQYREISRDDASRARMETLTGDTRPPVLAVDGKAIVGANEIIEWLGAHGELAVVGRQRGGTQGCDPAES